MHKQRKFRSEPPHQSKKESAYISVRVKFTKLGTEVPTIIIYIYGRFDPVKVHQGSVILTDHNKGIVIIRIIFAFKVENGFKKFDPYPGVETDIA